jgi:SET domain
VKMRNQIHVLKEYSSMECRKRSSKLFCEASLLWEVPQARILQPGHTSSGAKRTPEKCSPMSRYDPSRGKGWVWWPCGRLPSVTLFSSNCRYSSSWTPRCGSPPLIIDERARAAAMALTPNDPGASFSRKFANNSMGCSDEAQSPTSNRGLFLNLSRINHDCLGNTENMYLENRGVTILVACRPSAAREEITISYGDFRFYLENRQAALFNRYCFWCRYSACTNTSINADLRKMAHLDDETLRVGSMGMTENAMSSWHTFRTHYPGYDMFQMAVTKRKTLPIAKSQIRQAYKDALDFCHDDTWEEVQRMKSFVDAPQSHTNYLLFG